jgi:hypothetical protein
MRRSFVAVVIGGEDECVPLVEVPLVEDEDMISMICKG